MTFSLYLIQAPPFVFIFFQVRVAAAQAAAFPGPDPVAGAIWAALTAARQAAAVPLVPAAGALQHQHYDALQRARFRRSSR